MIPEVGKIYRTDCGNLVHIWARDPYDGTYCGIVEHKRDFFGSRPLAPTKGLWDMNGRGLPFGQYRLVKELGLKRLLHTHTLESYERCIIGG